MFYLLHIEELVLINSKVKCALPVEIINFDSVSITVPVFYLLHIKEVPVEDEQRDTTFPIWKNISTSNIIITRIDKVAIL